MEVQVPRMRAQELLARLRQEAQGERRCCGLRTGFSERGVDGSAPKVEVVLLVRAMICALVSCSLTVWTSK